MRCSGELRRHAVTRGGGAVVALVVMAACSAEPAKTSAAPPTVICGHTLIDSAAGATVTDVSGTGPVTVRYETVGGLVLKLSPACDKGSHMTVVPRGAARITGEAVARDGNLAGVVLDPRRRNFDVTVVHADGHAIELYARLGA